jgi:uncharacterized membrane protein
MRPQTILFSLIVFLLGAAGGLWAQASVLPTLAAHSWFQNTQFIQDWNARVQIIAPVQEIVVIQDQRAQEVVQKTQRMAVQVQTSVSAGSGLVVTSDGLVVTLVRMVPPGFPVEVLDSEGNIYPAQVLKRGNILALITIDQKNLQTAGFAKTPVLAESVFLVGKGKQGVFANQGIISQVTENQVLTSIIEETTAQGGILVNMQGQIVGIAQVDTKGRVSSVSPSLLQAFLGL